MLLSRLTGFEASVTSLLPKKKNTCLKLTKFFIRRVCIRMNFKYEIQSSLYN